MTELLYLEDSYIKDFDATVKEVNGKFIVLDKTAFYPQGGGQPTDVGTMQARSGEKYNVLFVKKIGSNISHEVDKDGLKEGDLVHCEIDWQRRYLFMRYHTAAHILSTVVHNHTSAKITGNQISETKARIDFNLEDFNRDEINKYVNEANEIIAKALPVNCEEMPREEAFKIPSIVKLKKILPLSIEKIRVVSIQGIDQQACAGTHVANTNEIGKIELIKVENKGINNRRLYFVLSK